MTLMPRSLAGQMLMLLAAALLIAQAINFTVLLNEVKARRTNFVEGGAIARTIDTVERVQSGLPVNRAGGNRGPDRLQVMIAANPARMQVRELALEKRISAALSQAGFKVSEIRASRQDDGVSRGHMTVSVRLLDGRWVNLQSMLPPADRRLAYPLIGQTLTLLLALLIAVIAIGRHVTRPLRRLSKAAESFGSSGRRDPVPLQGPGDVQQVIATFNQMQSRILDMLSEKDRMLGAIGHDLRTPLASLRLRAESVEDPVEREKMINTIEEMTSMLEDILSLARLGHPSEELVRTDLAALVDALVQDLQDLGQPITFEDDGRLLASVRPVVIGRAFRNLIENAVKYGERADVRLLREANEAVIQIDDQGPGIPDEDIDRVMEGFVRLEESRNRSTGGSGLGLTIARSIVNEHGGSLELRNLSPRGLRVIVRLPADG